MPLLRPIEPADHDFVLALNEQEVDVLSPMDADRLEQILGWSRSADVILGDDDQPVGFVVLVDGASDYDSDNFRWHRDRFASDGTTDFVYLDRVVLTEAARGQGLGTAVYDALEASVRPTPALALEVNADPPNVPSLRFHGGRGYAEVGRLGLPGKVVSMMVKDLT